MLVGARILFVAFAGYARIATLGEEVLEPERTLPRAITIAFGLVLVVYVGVGVGVRRVLEPLPVDQCTAAGPHRVCRHRPEPRATCQ